MIQPFPDADVLTFGKPSNNRVFSDPDDVVNKGSITKIDVRHGSKVDNIRFYYGTDGIGDLHGGSGGNPDTWSVPDGEQIVRIEGRTGDQVDSLQFFTDKGTASPRWGGTGGNPFSAQVPDGSALRTVTGCYDDTLQMINLHFGAPYFVKEVTVNPADVDKALQNVSPESASDQLLDNSQGTDQQTITYSDSYTTSVQNTFTFETGGSLKLSVEVGGGNGVASFKSGFSMTASASMTKSDSSTDTQTETWSIPVTVPAKTKVRATTVLQKQSVTLPFSYTIAWYKGSKTNILKQLTFGGTYQGVAVARVQHTFQEVV